MPTSSIPRLGPEMNGPRPTATWTVRYTGEKPPATLRAWCDAHADRVQEVEVGYGYSEGKAYDILLRPGWRMGDDYVHTIIEHTVFKALDQLRNIAKCDCAECGRLLAKTATNLGK